MHNIFFINLRLCKWRILLLSTKQVVITPEGISVFLSFQPLPTLQLAAQNQEPQTPQLLAPAIARPAAFPTSLLAFRKPSFWKSSSYPKQGLGLKTRWRRRSVNAPVDSCKPTGSTKSPRFILQEHLKSSFLNC
jgi:hypothetical protein